MSTRSWKYGDSIEDARLLVAVVDDLVLDGTVPVDSFDWRHPRSMSFEEWTRRADQCHPDAAEFHENEVCNECGNAIPVMVLALKAGKVVDSWGGVFFGEDAVCDDCSPV